MLGEISKDIAERIERLEKFRSLIVRYTEGGYRGNRRVALLNDDELTDLRAQINKEAHWARQQVIAARCFQTFTIGPPPIVGGLIASKVDAFGSMFNAPYGMDLFGQVVDMLDRTIGALAAGPPLPREEHPLQVLVRKNYAFIAMQMDETRGDLIDVLDAIKEAGNRCGIQAERIDDDNRNEPITDRMLESIRVAEHVIVDLSDERPNVFFEAGFAHGLGKIPIYIARAGTNLHFDLKDYPVIFYKSFRQLKDDLRAVSDRRTIHG
jgi:hypothetical protein